MLCVKLSGVCIYNSVEGSFFLYLCVYLLQQMFSVLLTLLRQQLIPYTASVFR